MPRKRSQLLDRLKAKVRRATAILLAVSVVLLGILWLVTSLTRALIPPAYPGLAQFVRGVLFMTVLAGLGYLWWGWQRRRRTRVRFHRELFALTPVEFEQAVGDILTDLGYRSVRRTGGAGDLAADLEARDPTGRRVVVQCKRYAPGSRVGSPDVQAFLGMATVHHRAARGIFVTTAEFTEPARALAEEHRIELIDGARLGIILEKIHRPTDRTWRLPFLSALRTVLSADMTEAKDVLRPEITTDNSTSTYRASDDIN